jgi:hypothetical protein
MCCFSHCLYCFRSDNRVEGSAGSISSLAGNMIMLAKYHTMSWVKMCQLMCDTMCCTPILRVEDTMHIYLVYHWHHAWIGTFQHTINYFCLTITPWVVRGAQVEFGVTAFEQFIPKGTSNSYLHTWWWTWDNYAVSLHCLEKLRLPGFEITNV